MNEKRFFPGHHGRNLLFSFVTSGP